MDINRNTSIEEIEKRNAEIRAKRNQKAHKPAVRDSVTAQTVDDADTIISRIFDQVLDADFLFNKISDSDITVHIPTAPHRDENEWARPDFNPKNELSMFSFSVPAVCAAPRMTRQDSWLDPPRPAVQKYREFSKLLKTQIPDSLMNDHGLVRTIKPFGAIQIIVFIGVPASASNKQREAKLGTPHFQRPDGDNILKAVCDSLFYVSKEDKNTLKSLNIKAADDGCIWNKQVKKYWGDEDRIDIKITL